MCLPVFGVDGHCAGVGEAVGVVLIQAVAQQLLTVTTIQFRHMQGTQIVIHPVQLPEEGTHTHTHTHTHTGRSDVK